MGEWIRCKYCVPMYINGKWYLWNCSRNGGIKKNGGGYEFILSFSLLPLRSQTSVLSSFPYVMHPFPPSECFQNVHFVCSFSSLIMVFRCGFLCVYTAWDPLSYLGLWINIFYQFEENFSHFFKYSLWLHYLPSSLLFFWNSYFTL
jgi:hypothetical protein